MEVQASGVQRSLDLGSGPLLRGAWFRLGQLSGRLLLVVHHLAIDGVSWRVLLEDLDTAYRQIRSGQPPALPPKTTARV